MAPSSNGSTLPPLSCVGPEVDLALEVEPLPIQVQATIRAGVSLLISGMEAEAIWTTMFGEWLAVLAPDLPPSLRTQAYSLGLSLVNDATISNLNSTWRQKDGPTDVLAFAAQEEAPPLPPTQEDQPCADALELGDIVVSLETASRQALEAGHSLEQELLFLVSHGLLHLLGWDHPDEPSLEAMLSRQNDLLSHTARLFPVIPELCGGESPRYGAAI